MRSSSPAPVPARTESLLGERPHDRLHERERALVAVVYTLVAHLLVLWLVPRDLEVPAILAEERASKTIAIRLAPQEDPALEGQFIRAPLDVPEEIPDETPFFSDRNQRAAQEQMVPPNPENQPAVEGDNPDSNRVVQGDPFQQDIPTPPSSAGSEGGGSPLQQREAAPQQEIQEAETPEALVMEPSAEEGLRAEPEPVTDPSEEAETAREQVRVESREDGRGQDQVTTPAAQGGEQSQTPRPRPRVVRDNSFGPLRQSTSGAVSVGRVSVDSNYSEFGDYWRRVAEIIERRWNMLIYESRSSFTRGTAVSIEFALTREGRVVDAKVIEATAGRLAETFSMDAITSQAPYEPWSPEMILTGEQQMLQRVTFYY